MRSVLFRTDASSEVALGHLKRCLALAAAFKERGVACRFLCLDDPAARRLVPDAIWTQVSVGEGDDLARVAETATQMGAGLVVIDSYKADRQYLENLRAQGLSVAVFDDYGTADPPVDAVINGIVGADVIAYAAPLRLLGPAHLVMAPAYWNAPPARNAAVRRAMVTLGGIDHYDISAMFIRVMGRLLAGVAGAGLDVVIGPYYENKWQIELAAKSAPIPVTLHQSPDGLAAIIAVADVACSAGGTTLYELAAYGVPTVGIALWENQRPNVKGLAAEGALVPVYFEKGFNDEALEKAISLLLVDPRYREGVARRAQALVDGQGSRRVAAALANAFLG